MNLSKNNNSNKKKIFIYFLLLFLIQFYFYEIFPITSVVNEVYAEVSSLLSNNPLELNNFKSFLGYDQAYKEGKFFSSHPPGTSIILLPFKILVGIPIETILEKFTNFNKKNIFIISGNFTLFISSYVVFAISIIYIIKFLKDADIKNIFSIIIIYTLISPSFYLINYSLRETIIISICVINLVSFYFFLKEYSFYKNSYLISGILMILVRESLILVPLISAFSLYLIENKNWKPINIIFSTFKFVKSNFKILFYIFLIISISTLILSIKNYYLIGEFGPLESQKYFDPNGPFDKKISKYASGEEWNNIKINFNLKHIKQSFFDLRLGIFAFYILNILLFYYFIKNIFRSNLHKESKIKILYLNSFLILLVYFIFHVFFYYWFPAGRQGLLGWRHILFAINLFYLISLVIISCNLKDNFKFFFSVFLFLEILKNIILLFTTPRIPKLFKNDTFVFFKSNLKILQDFGCNIFNFGKKQDLCIDGLLKQNLLLSSLSLFLFIIILGITFNHIKILCTNNEQD